MTDSAHLEQAFKEAVAGLPNYKRLAAHHYVAHLRAELVRKDREISKLAGRVIDLEEQKGGVL